MRSADPKRARTSRQIRTGDKLLERLSNLDACRRRHADLGPFRAGARIYTAFGGISSMLQLDSRPPCGGVDRNVMIASRKLCTAATLGTPKDHGRACGSWAASAN